MSQNHPNSGQIRRPFSYQLPPNDPSSPSQHERGTRFQQANFEELAPIDTAQQPWSGYPEQRFSYIETPIEDSTQEWENSGTQGSQRVGTHRSQQHGTHQSSSLQQEVSSAPTPPPQPFPVEKTNVTRMPSAYQLAPPTQPHPAFQAPYAESEPSSSPLQSTAPRPEMFQAQPDHDVKQPPLSPGPVPVKQAVPASTSAPTRTYSPFSPYAATQAHPHSTSTPPPTFDRPPTMVDTQAPRATTSTPTTTWTHSLCACADLSTCTLGFCCPCILYGRVTHRLSQASLKRDPTDLLGYSACNASCMTWTLLCGVGLQALLTGLAVGRVRRRYDIEGSSVGDFCGKGCCCCCCALVQADGELQSREARREGYKRVDGMVYG